MVTQGLAPGRPYLYLTPASLRLFHETLSLAGKMLGFHGNRFFSAQVNLSTETSIDASQSSGCCPLLLHPSRLPSASEPRAGRLLWAPAGFYGPLFKASPHTLAGRGRRSRLGRAALGVKPGHPQSGSPSSERGSNRAPTPLPPVSPARLRHGCHTFPFLFPRSPGWGGPEPPPESL